LSFFVENCYD